MKTYALGVKMSTGTAGITSRRVVRSRPPWASHDGSRLLLWAVSAATGPRSTSRRLQGRPPAATAADDRARALLALAPGGERAAALQALSPPQLIEVSAALAALADGWRLAGQTADALAAARAGRRMRRTGVGRPGARAGAEPAGDRHSTPAATSPSRSPSCSAA